MQAVRIIHIDYIVLPFKKNIISTQQCEKKWLNATVDFLTIFFSILKEIEVHNAIEPKPV